MHSPIIETRAFRLLLALLPYTLAVLVYAPAMGNGFLWDDHPLIAYNSHVHDLSRVWDLVTHDFWHVADSTSIDSMFVGRYYRPVVTLAFAIQGALFDVNPAGFHFVSLLLHLASCALVYRALGLRLRGEPNTRALGASIGTMLFAIHPTRPEAVGWISGSTDLWMMFWALVALNVWLTHRARIGGLVVVAIASVLSLLSKESAIVLPVALALDAWLLADDEANVGRDLRRSLAVAVPVFAALALRAHYLPIESSGAFTGGLSVVVPRVLASVGEYMIAIVWHVPGTVWMAEVRYDDHGPTYATSVLVVGALTVIAGLALLIAAWRTKRLRPWLADAMWLAIFMAPVANILPLAMRTLVAARFLYAPLFGAVALVARVIDTLGMRGRRGSIAAVAGVAVAISAIFSVSSIRQLDSFEDDEALWEYEHAINPENINAISRLLSTHGSRYDEARVLTLLRELKEQTSKQRSDPFQELEAFRKALGAVSQVSSSKEVERLAAVARTYDDLMEKGDAFFAIEGMSMSVQAPPGTMATIAEMLPSIRTEHALVHVHAANPARAEEILLEALEALPRDGRAWFYLARVRALRADWAGAHAALERAAETGIASAKIASLGAQIEEAEAHWKAPNVDEALRRARAYEALASQAMVRPIAEAALRSRPGDPDFVEIMVTLELSERRSEAAEAWLRSGREAAPGEEARWRAIEERVERMRERL